ncbi:DMT family transporter [Halalkalibacter krulwichiae]|uniref:Inner membrane protein YtfF n=1 Tax=Halalkalibacter krulwichiae TaxID=199441 RepID=A0A1X9ME36_9BACI|nr:DMT family transporter [Halalkalibacter krulwichiae]ARK30393.1 Inner membrane protein YtfF [Halalkalibacter krulwichiae]
MKGKSLMFTYGIVFVVMIIWGLNVVFLKVLVEAFPPVTMTAFRIMVAGIAAFSIIWFGRSMKKLTRKEWKLTLLATIFGVLCHHSFLALGLANTNASNAVLILALLPLITSIFAALFLKDHLTKWRLFGISLGFFGVLFIQGASGSWAVDLGEFYVFLAVLVQAISFIYIKKATESLDSKQMTSIMFLVGSIGLFMMSFLVEPASVTSILEAPLWVYVIFILSAILATTVGHFLFNEAIAQIGAGQAAIFNNFVPFFGLLFSALFLNENIYWYQSFGFMFITVGVLFGTGYVEKAFIKSKYPVQEKNI